MGESMKDYEVELNASFKKIEEGEILKGIVISVTEKDIILDLKYYAEGIIPIEYYSNEPEIQIKEDVHIGDEISATVLKKDDGNGNILLSKIAADEVLSWNRLQELKNNKNAFMVTIKGIVNSGVIAYVEGIRGFIPASKLALTYVEDCNSYLNKQIQVQVFEVDEKNRKLILSAKELLQEKAESERRAKVSNVEVGLVTDGVVERIQKYGAFVNIGNGLTGLLHISQISEKRLKTPWAVLNEGDSIKVKIIRIEDGKISLSMKALADEASNQIEEEVFELPEAEEATTTLGSLFANIKL